MNICHNGDIHGFFQRVNELYCFHIGDSGADYLAARGFKLFCLADALLSFMRFDIQHRLYIYFLAI